MIIHSRYASSLWRNKSYICGLRFPRRQDTCVRCAICGIICNRQDFSIHIERDVETVMLWCYDRRHQRPSKGKFRREATISLRQILTGFEHLTICCRARLLPLVDLLGLTPMCSRMYTHHEYHTDKAMEVLRRLIIPDRLCNQVRA
jgi:hypothetical protein